MRICNHPGFPAMSLLIAIAMAATITPARSQELFPAVQRLKQYCLMTAPIGYSPRLGVLTLTP